MTAHAISNDISKIGLVLKNDVASIDLLGELDQKIASPIAKILDLMRRISMARRMIRTVIPRIHLVQEKMPEHFCANLAISQRALASMYKKAKKLPQPLRWYFCREFKGFFEEVEQLLVNIQLRNAELSEKKPGTVLSTPEEIEKYLAHL